MIALMTEIERIRREVSQLPYRERETLVRFLELDLDSVAPSSEVEASWDAEIETRVMALESGEVNLLSREEFDTCFSEARRELAVRRQTGA